MEPLEGYNLDAVSTCKIGQEKYKGFTSRINRKKYVQYEFRADDGELFSCVKPTLEACRIARDKWLDERKGV